MNNKSKIAQHTTVQNEAKLSIVAPTVIPEPTLELASEMVPAVKVTLHGQHLIEASAGTGKTWTLTGIVLRLLIEAKRAPEHIIATTFTRAAAAEMRERIHARLVDFYQVLQWLNKLQANRDMHPFSTRSLRMWLITMPAALITIAVKIIATRIIQQKKSPMLSVKLDNYG